LCKTIPFSLARGYNAYKMTVEKPSWQSIAELKRAALQELLPVSFQIESVPLAEKLPNVTDFIQTFLSPAELDITENHSAEVLQSKLTAGELSATEVTKAFCHRATIAHQLVSIPKPSPTSLPNHRNRLIASVKFSFLRRSVAQRNWMSIIVRMENPSVLCTAFLSPSKIHSGWRAPRPL
jgi:hypothetical protein